jgi:hypothetical protein
VGLGKVTRAMANPEHARRVAWRILKDWIEVQLALVEAGLASADEALFRHMVGAGGKTIYEMFREQHRSLPAPQGGGQ